MNKIFFGDFHTNISSAKLNELDEWVDFAKDMLDFWAPVYYPYFINRNEFGFKYEDTHDDEQIKKDWAFINDYIQKRKDMIIYPAYEWQGDGSDGDHNVFFLDTNAPFSNTKTYKELYESLKDRKVMALSHHPGYQSNHRGKNWGTHIEKFSPVTEIYSSHGSSEEDGAAIPLNVHIHMGPRAETGTVYYALKNGIKTGIIASGDNHVCPAISGNGFFGVVGASATRESIFEAIQKKQTYGVSRNRIKLDYTIDGNLMGSEVIFNKGMSGSVDVVAGSTIDRIEVLRNGVIDHVYVHSGTWERNALSGKTKFKFELELGWGPDRRVFNDISERIWNVELQTEGEIVSVEKLWTSPGNKIIESSKKKFKAEVLTRKELQGDGKLQQKNYMTPNIQNQSLIFEIEDEISNSLKFIIDDETYEISIQQLLNESILKAREAEVHDLLKERFKFEEYYREDPWWHNAYKIKFHRASPQVAYTCHHKFEINDLEKDTDALHVKVIQKNGEVAWSSPIWIERGK